MMQSKSLNFNENISPRAKKIISSNFQICERSFTFIVNNMLCVNVCDVANNMHQNLKV